MSDACQRQLCQPSQVSKLNEPKIKYQHVPFVKIKTFTHFHKGLDYYLIEF
jgi:hypothetical protein